MHVMRESWTDARLDDFRAEVDRRFDEVDRRLEKVEAEIKDLRGEMKSGFEAVNKTMLNGILILSGSYIAGFAALVGLVATQI
jgi:tetrahydromethanopterin S-methyltransferase subunit G